MRLMFLHGWGFDAALWNGVRAALAPMASIAGDRGYFGDPMKPHCDGPVLAIGHSLGSLLLAGDPPPDCVGLIAINGFDRFAGEGAVPRRVINRMRRRFAVDASAVLDDFRQRCGTGRAVGTCDARRLGDDLDLLATGDVRGAVRPLLVLHGGNDPILPPAMRDAVFGDAPRKASPDGGHLLPLTHAEWCAEQIRAVLP